MKKSAILFALLFCSAFPLFAQSTQFGVIVGGSRRFVDTAHAAPGTTLSDDSFDLSNSTFDIFYSTEIEPGTAFKLKAGRIQTQVGFADGTEDVNGNERDLRHDVEGEVQHVEGIIEYRFSEPFGSTSLFGGVGLYRHSSDTAGFDTMTDLGFSGGVNADFPITRRYGLVVEGTYHWTQAEFHPRYMTLGAGLRIAF
ncbi:MAG TPA: outer membrane beta-barrel protein [Thermoanaerobaculia bacterium]|nr:outer membrane beta-barrel protein [Thermoanaerobaculia bacterium]